MSLDCRESGLEEATDECVVPDGECHGRFGRLVFVGAGKSTDDEATVVGGVLPKFLRGFLVRLAAVAGKGDALIFVKKHAVLG